MDTGMPLAQAQSHETLLVVAETVVLIRKGSAVEYSFGVHKIDSVVLQVPLALNLVPRKPHRAIVYSQCIYVKAPELAAV